MLCNVMCTLFDPGPVAWVIPEGPSPGVPQRAAPPAATEGKSPGWLNVKKIGFLADALPGVRQGSVNNDKLEEDTRENGVLSRSRR
jgi:hypothetical protein